jgi:hypothetical protein
VTGRGRTVWGVVVATTQNPLFEQLPSCEACGSPVFVLRYGLAADVLDLGDPRAWMVVDRGCIIEPIAGGIHAANVCTACGRIGDLQTDRAIIWNVEGQLAGAEARPRARPTGACRVRRCELGGSWRV